MAKRFPPVHALVAFEAAAHASSFAVAANQLCITPSALSHRIRLLEEFVGDRLFIRDGRAPTLTPFGRSYLDVVCSALQTLTDFPMPGRTTPAQPRIKLTVPPTFARYLLLPRLAGFTSAHPDIVVDVYLSVPLYDLAPSESDLEVRFGAGKYPDLETVKLLEEPAFPVATPAYLERIGGIASPAELAKATLLRSALEPWKPWFEVAGLDWPEPTTNLRIDDLGLLLEAVRLGQGVGLTRQHFAQEMIEKGEVVELFGIRLASPPHAYYVVYEQGMQLRPEVKLFVDWLMATYAGG
ncbi:LysR substrate-binding domain-containing protein [Pseudoduganella lutea]|uniref:LysR family transcriptional regulator n=1 Tax=Pseudoduganella lutea TaxID=321985 RepID=A0A4P6KSM7_9BURK|nr:LysR substrate-binding domain-containing protein [Pseudoduganella lutea]QBE61686.1 LysR family transcriptional regulator [Pseudoduganella lutea]